MNIRKVRELHDGFKGNAALYRLDDGNHIVVSAVPWAFDHRGPETLIFNSDADGNISDWTEIRPGSDRGHMSHQRAISEAGWTLVDDNGNSEE